jgi:bisphosphoglycerate-dependent phosphoglycerate mutase
MVIEIVFETHSTSTDNEPGIATGWLDGELSRLAGARRSSWGERGREGGHAAVFTSDLARAVETAEIAFPGAGVRARVGMFLADLPPVFEGGRILVIGHTATRWRSTTRSPTPASPTS